MLSKSTKQHLVAAVANQAVADEIEKRLEASPADAAEAAVAVATWDRSLDAKIRERVVIAMAGDARGSAGRKLAAKVLGVSDVVEALAAGGAEAAVVASFSGQVAGMTTDVEIEADVAGEAGNITLIADSLSDIDTLIADWNAANVGNEVSLTSGDGSQIPTADIELTGGAEAGDPALEAAQASLASKAELMSRERECVVSGMSKRDAAEELLAAVDASVAMAAAL